MADRKSNQLYPLFVNLTGRRILIVGGGPVAARKVQALIRSGARVTVVAPTLTSRLAQLAQNGGIEYLPRPYQPGDLADAVMVFVACGDEQVNRSVFEEASARGIFCNVADEPGWCTFYVPSVVRRGPLQIAISTGGTSPALAKRLRLQLEKLFDASYEAYLDALAQLRRHVRRAYPDDQARRAAVLESFLDSDALELLRQGKNDQFETLLNRFLHQD
jgi:precorrin-2 dehydrogenase / sirohydrochlorin ferrochelatase